MPDCKEYMDVYDVGCFTHCGDIDTGLLANSSGIHTLMFDFRGVTRIVKVYARKGESIKIPNKFNESSEQHFKIYDPIGQRYVFEKYWPWAAHCSKHDLFKIKIKIGVDVTDDCNTVCCEEPITVCSND